jgi:hypothetical protein
MGWLFGQVWILCAIAFLAGALVTWLVFVRPARRPPVARGDRPSPRPAPLDEVPRQQVRQDLFDATGTSASVPGVPQRRQPDRSTFGRAPVDPGANGRPGHRG